jgi:hypothetical protein
MKQYPPPPSTFPFVTLHKGAPISLGGLCNQYPECHGEARASGLCLLCEDLLASFYAREMRNLETLAAATWGWFRSEVGWPITELECSALKAAIRARLTGRGVTAPAPAKLSLDLRLLGAPQHSDAAGERAATVFEDGIFAAIAPPCHGPELVVGWRGVVAVGVLLAAASWLAGFMGGCADAPAHAATVSAPAAPAGERACAISARLRACVFAARFREGLRLPAHVGGVRPAPNEFADAA